MSTKSHDASTPSPSPKLGAGALQAAGRLGLEELRNAVSMGTTNVEAPTQPGALGTVTPVEVERQKQSEPQFPPPDRPDGKTSIFDTRMEPPQASTERAREDRDPHREQHLDKE
jgi:hypothetical protein